MTTYDSVLTTVHKPAYNQSSDLISLSCGRGYIDDEDTERPRLSVGRVPVNAISS